MDELQFERAIVRIAEVMEEAAADQLDDLIKALAPVDASNEQERAKAEQKVYTAISGQFDFGTEQEQTDE